MQPSSRGSLSLVVMAGGSGTRFWPRSTRRRPKQLLTFGKGRLSLLGQTLARFDGLVAPDRRLVVTTEALRAAIESEAPGVAVLGEPEGRNTAPCIYWAARTVAAENPEAIMLVMSADHHVTDPERFRQAVAAAAAWAANHDDLITLGVTPTRPETGYGYLRLGAPLGEGCVRVAAFVEKPSRERAEEFLRSGAYLWNSGTFVWRAAAILEAFDRLAPEMREAWESGGGDVTRAYPRMPRVSVDYAVMEKADNVAAFPLDCGWEDVGSWGSLEALAGTLGARRPGGTLLGGELLAVQAEGNIVDTPGKLVALLGVNDLIVVEQGCALLIARKDMAQEVRQVVEEVKRLRPDLA